MNINEYQLFATPVWEMQNEIDETTLKRLIDFSYNTVKLHPIKNAVSKRNGFNSEPIAIANSDLMKILKLSIAGIKHAYQPIVEISVEKYWININPPGAYNVRHNHPRSVLAATLYLQTPENSGNLVIHNMNSAQQFAAYSSKPATYNFTEYRITPQPGTFVAFPGWVDHSVDINTSDTDRISISMNIITKEV